MAEPLKRVTMPTRAVIGVMLDDVTSERYGLDIARATGLKAGTLYPILARLVEYGWLTVRWEDVSPSAEGRPRRKFYKLTAEGISLASQISLETPQSMLRWLNVGGLGEANR